VAWRRSGQSQAEYCRRQALEIKKFGYWQRKWAKEQAARPVAFYPLIAAESDARGQATPTPFLLQVKENRFAIEVGGRFSSATLKRLIAILEEL
jgi:hypothetical protein